MATGDLRRGNPRFSRSNIQRVNAALAQFRPIADAHQATISQIVIAWTIAQAGITSVLCGARDPRQAMENAAAGKIVLSADEIEAIEKAAGAMGIWVNNPHGV